MAPSERRDSRAQGHPEARRGQADRLAVTEGDGQRASAGPLRVGGTAIWSRTSSTWVQLPTLSSVQVWLLNVVGCARCPQAARGPDGLEKNASAPCPLPVDPRAGRLL